MILHIRNMVCNRCRTAVRSELEAMGLHPVRVDLGEAELAEEDWRPELREELHRRLEALGFSLIDSRQARLIEELKRFVIRSVRGEEPSPYKLSEQLARHLKHDYSYLSHLFSSVEGITIEQYHIRQKIERVKELMLYDELSLAQIALDLGYSSTAHLSAQFKSVTGLTPTQFRKLGGSHRKGLDEVGVQK